MKGEGVVSGVADLILLVPNAQYHGLCIEMKTTSKGSRQSTNQKAWEAAVTDCGYDYKVARSLDGFREIVNEYLNTTVFRRVGISTPTFDESRKELIEFLNNLERKERNGK